MILPSAMLSLFDNTDEGVLKAGIRSCGICAEHAGLNAAGKAFMRRFIGDYIE